MNEELHDDLPYQPTDREIESVAREAIKNDNFSSLEDFLFSHTYLSPGWVCYIATSELCVHAQTIHAERLEHIVKRGLELNDAPVLIELAIQMVEGLYGRLGDKEGEHRLRNMRRALLGRMQLENNPDAP